MDIKMKPNDSQPGWLNEVQDAGCNVTYRLEAFGRTEWLLKKDGEAIQVRQGKSTALTTKIEHPTEKQREIAMLLASIGIATVLS